MKTEISRAIIRLREARGLTQEGLSRLSGVPQSTIAGVEKARSAPGIEVLLKLASGLGITPNDVLQEAGLIKQKMIAEKGSEYGDPLFNRLMLNALAMDQKSRTLLVKLSDLLSKYLNEFK